VGELDISMVFVILTITCNLGVKNVSNVKGNICLHFAIKIGPVILTLVMTDLETENVFNRGNFSDGRYYNNNNQRYSRNFNRANGNFRREDSRPPYYQRDQSNSCPFNASQQDGLNVNNEVATKHVQENKKVLIIQGFPSREFPNKMEFSDENR
jgi:hypothetical protein